MEQLTQKLKSGEMKVSEVPIPQVSKGMVLVRNHYSIISAGTEGSTVKTARKSLIEKAKSRPQDVKQVVDSLKKQGPIATYRAVMKKLDAYSPLGYSSAGVVIEVGEGVTGFQVGDKVACAGAGYANHAEVVSVPENLCVKLSEEADLKKASYNTVGAIALQGIRQADLRLGESCAVIGLGLLGQLTCLMLKASGVKTIGIDIDDAAVKLAGEHAANYAWTRNDPAIESGIENATNGLGVDTVIITAGTPSLDPINFAGKICRKKGTVIVVGAVPTGFDRDPYYYRKELSLKMSCSYGPGRYDLNYEEKGIDYPAAYVRWTENRNMAAFQDLISTNQIDIQYLTTHTFPFEKVADAYNMIVEKTEPFVGIALEYDTEKELIKNDIVLSQPTAQSKVGIAFIGAGSYAQGNLLPYIPKTDSDVINRAILTQSGTTAKRVAEKFNFERCAADDDSIYSDNNINTVFVATRHDSHAKYSLETIKRGKNLFVEKPLCLTTSELKEIKSAYNGKQHLMIGFNRRFSPLSKTLKKKLGNGPCSMNYRVNAGAIPIDHWIQDIEIGGGRIVGEACHFIDYLAFVCGSVPTTVYATAMKTANNLNDTVSITMNFEDGSIGTVTYYANGSKELQKEYIEVFSNGSVAILNDFKELQIYGKGKPFKEKLLNQDKGQKQMINELIDAIKNGTPTPIPSEQIFKVMDATFAVQESITNKSVVNL